jgi:hypothetical protein
MTHTVTLSHRHAVTLSLAWSEDFAPSWLAGISSGKFCCKNLAKTRDQWSSALELVTAPFSRFFIKTTPNCCLTGVVALCQFFELFCALAI